MLAMVCAGICAALHKKPNLSACHGSATLVGKVVNSTSNRFGLAPPPSNLDLKSEIVLLSLDTAIVLVSSDSYIYKVKRGQRLLQN
jgi:hypothetical protein